MHLLVFANFYDSIILARNEIIAFSKFYFLLCIGYILEKIRIW